MVFESEHQIERRFAGRGVLFAFLAGIMAASAAIGHTKVDDPTVRAWMAGMIQVASATKTLGAMAKGDAAFDADAANEAARRISDGMARIPDLFRVQASDPTSEALPEIWSDWDKFVALADKAQNTAATTEIASPDDLRPALKKIGATCSACHEAFRE